MYHNKRGQGLVEFALILPLLLLVLFTIVDTAFAIQGYLTVNHAAREAARFAVVYIPLQGECLNRDFNGGPIYEPWPYCPLDYQEQANEPDENYFDRRVELIKLRAIESTTGLRVDRVCKDLQCIADNYGESGMLGVRVWGFQAFDAPEQEERPGLPGLPVRVEVTHNVPLVIFGAFLPNAMVRVTSNTDMINEGIQVGFGNLAPPTFSPGQPAVPPGTALPTNTPGPSPTVGPTPTPTPIPVYNISLSPKTALNVLPTERQHLLIAHITDELGANFAGARVTFRTDQGSFHPSGVGTKTASATTGADGRARITLFANAPLSANLVAWLDYNGDWLIDANEPSDTAAKTYTANGPYLTVSSHAPAPLEWLAVSLMDHNPLQNPYSLWWCPDSITATQVTAQLGFPLNINVTNHLEDVPVQVPLGVAGRYRIESHTGSGGANGCSEPGTLVAYSAPIEIATIPPDLVVESVTIVDEEYIRPGEPITIVITVRNQSPIAVDSAPFDVDVYMPLVNPPQIRQMGVSKHWVGNLPPLGTFQITTTATLYDLAPQQLWVQVDTTDYVDEGDVGGEDNNVHGPVIVQARTCVPIRGRSDDFDGGLGGQWAGIDFPTPGHAVVGGQLQIMPNRGNLGGTLDGGHYVYQAPISGDFRAIARVLSIDSTDNDSEAGLMARESFALDSRYFAALAERNNRFTQDARLTTGGNGAESGGTGASRPLWVRIDRIGDTFRAYYSNNGTSWTERGTARTITMDPVYIGLVANSDSRDIPGPALFDDFSVCVPSGGSCTPIPGRDDNFDSGLGGQWLSETLLRGSESAAGTLSVLPGWGDIGNPASYDSFRYLYQSPVSGNFSMTVRVLDVQSSDGDSDAGLMVREALEPDARSYAFLQRGSGALDRRYRTTPGNNDSSSTNSSVSAPQYLRITRQGTVFKSWSSADGNNWTLRRTDTLAAIPDPVYIGLASSADTGSIGPAIYDDFEICTPYDASNLPTPPGPPEVYPPGLVQCTELLMSTGFEGNPVNVFNVWKPGDANGLTGAFARTSAEFYQGSFSLRLHASNSVIPCASNQLQPYLYQDVTFPAGVFTQSTLTVAGYYRVAGSNLTCSMPNSPDADDKLRVGLRQTNGTPIVAPQDIINGGMAMGQWYPLSVGLHTFIPNISIYKNQTLRLQWEAFNDMDINGTFFYMDELSAQLCTEWEIPPDAPDTASVGGKVTTRGENNIPTALPGADVWAYTQGGEPYHTRSIHDGTYHFYNIPPGTYIIYAEAWVGGQLRTVMTQVTLGNNERNYAVNLLLQ